MSVGGKAMFENRHLYSVCENACCTILAGACLPADFGLPEEDPEKIIAAIRSGRYTIDWWEGDPRKGSEEVKQAFFVRPAHKGREGITQDPSWGGVCTFYEDKQGCQLGGKDRPSECRYLEPKKGGKCVVHEEKTKQNAAIAWMPHTYMLRTIIEG